MRRLKRTWMAAWMPPLGGNSKPARPPMPVQHGCWRVRGPNGLCRGGVLSWYAPTPNEAAALADRVIAQAYAPVGRVGYWVRRSVAVAAAIAIVAHVHGGPDDGQSTEGKGICGAR